MQLVHAVVKGQPRQVVTKYGDRAVLDCVTSEGEKITIWRNAGDLEVVGRRDGERITVALDSKGKPHLMASLSSGLVDPTETNGNGNGNSDSSRKAEIADYINRLAQLYGYTFKKVKEQMSDSGLPIECVKDISTSVFIATTRHFDL